MLITLRLRFPGSQAPRPLLNSLRMRVAVRPVGEELHGRRNLAERQRSRIASGLDGVPDRSDRCVRLAVRIAANRLRNVIVDRVPDVFGVVEDRRAGAVERRRLASCSCSPNGSKHPSEPIGCRRCGAGASGAGAGAGAGAADENVSDELQRSFSASSRRELDASWPRSARSSPICGVPLHVYDGSGDVDHGLEARVCFAGHLGSLPTTLFNDTHCTWVWDPIAA